MSSEAKSVEYPDVEISFKGFSTEHSWYKHITGEINFLLIPFYGKYPYQRNEPLADAPALYWFMLDEPFFKKPYNRLSPFMQQIMKTASDPVLQKVILANKVRVTPFVYTENHGFDITLGRWGWEMFDWLEVNDYTEEAKLIKKDTVEYESGGVYYNGKSSHNTEKAKGPVADLYSKEQERILADMRTGAANIWKVVKENDKIKDFTVQ